VTLYVGTSGWQYRHWVGPFYPRKPRVDDDLACFAERFQTVELNGTFYRLPERRTFEDWARRTPDDFVFAAKASRFITHIKRLRDAREPVERLMSRAEALGEKLGPVLLQLPPNLERDDDLLDAAVRESPAERASRSNSGTSRGSVPRCGARSSAVTPRCASRTAARGSSRRCGAQRSGDTYGCTVGAAIRADAMENVPWRRGRSWFASCSAQGQPSSCTSTTTGTRARSMTRGGSRLQQRSSGCDRHVWLVQRHRALRKFPTHMAPERRSPT
jgi:hypothetical protein